MITMHGLGPDTTLQVREEALAALRREKRAQTDGPQADRLQTDGSQAVPASQRLVLATCDRVELYEGSGPADPETAAHLFALAAGIKSPLLGENAILGQIKRSYEAWRLGSDTDPTISRSGDEAAPGREPNPGMHLLFQSALCCGKLVRTKTGLSRGAMGHAQAALEVLKSLGGSAGKKVLCVGINKFMEELIQGLGASGWADLCLINRDQDKARAAAGQAVCRYRGFDALADELASCDIVFSATSAPHTIIHPDSHRFDRPALLFDLAVPRDIDGSFADQPGIRLFNIQDLEARMAFNRDARHALLPRAQALVDQEVQAYLQKAARRFGIRQGSAQSYSRESCGLDSAECPGESPVQASLADRFAAPGVFCLQ